MIFLGGSMIVMEVGGMFVMSWKEGACLSCHESRGHVCHVMEGGGMFVMSWK